VRIVLCIALFTRSALIWHFAPAVVGPVLTHVAFYIAGSIALTRSSAPIDRLLLISVLLDTTLAFAALLGNVLRPWSGYDGVVSTPDFAALAMATLAGGLRLSPRAAVFSVVLNAACFVALLVLDHSLYELPRGGGYYQYMLQGSFLAATATMAIV